MLANPTGGAVVAGSATIGAAGKTLTINQSSNTAIINWQTFSIAYGETTKFLVPNSSSATLNYVLGGNPSAIYGTLSSNGALYLINPSGILVGSSGQINTASFLGSTLNANNNEFLANGNLHFSGSSTAGIDNQGSISASSGNVYLIANQVSNEGSLTAPQGDVGMAAGSSVLLQQSGDQHLFVQSNPIGTTRAVGVSNAGTIQAATTELRAAGGNAYALAINNTGSIAATGYKKINGQVYLTADTGVISNSGSIQATGSANGGTVSLASQSGTIKNSGSINASATAKGGHGGSVSLISTSGTTIQTGAIVANGGQGGVGGNAEISGSVLQFGGTVDLTAPGGKTGNLTLDPGTLQVITGGTGTVTSGQNDSTSTTIDPGTIATALNSANLILNADTNITVTNEILWTSGNTLTLSTNLSGSTININAPIMGTAGTLKIQTEGAGDQITTGANGSIDVNSFLLENGSWVQNGTLPGFTANNFEILGSSSFLRVTGGTGTSTPFQITDIYGLEGLSSPSNKYLTSDAELMNNIDASGTSGWNGGLGWTPIGRYDGSNSSDANTYSGVFNGNNYTISGLTINAPSSSFAGLFGDTASSATVENLNLTNVSIIGNIYVGGLAGVSNATGTDVTTSGSVTGNSLVGGLLGINGGIVSSSSSAGSVNGNTSSNVIGGLIGESQFGSITGCSSTANVLTGSSSGSYEVGGLVGFSDTPISSSTSSGNVTGQSDVGGLVGSNESTITSSSSTSDVTGETEVGGLAGANYSVISESYSTGDVRGTSGIGGLVGTNASGTITQSYSTGGVNGSSEVGGLVGENVASIKNSFSTGTVTGSESMIGGLIGYNTGTVVDSYTVSPLVASGATLVGGLAGDNVEGSFTNTFWDTTTAGVTKGVGSDTGSSTAGVTGASTTSLENSTFINSNSTTPLWDFTNTWSTNDGTTVPQLIGVGGPGGTVSSGSGSDTLSGIAYTNGGLTPTGVVTITLIFDGSVIGTTQTNSSGDFSFNVNPIDISSGLVLTDATDKGNTFFQSGSSETSFSGIDIWGSTLRIIADVASNATLKTALGSLTGNGINYAVTSGALTTNTGININIVSNYNVSGNITAGGTLNTVAGSSLTDSASATLQGTSVSLEGYMNMADPIVVHSTSGEIFLDGVGDSDTPAVFNGLTLSSTGDIDIQSSYLTLPSGNFSATGVGYTSNTDANGEANGVNIFDTNIIASGGNITITGTSGYTTTEGTTYSGQGVGIGSDGESPVSISTTGNGNITITGTVDQNITSAGFVGGVDIFQDGSGESGINTISVENGSLSITGNVTKGTSQGSMAGVFLDAGGIIEATGSGSVSISGNSSGGTVQGNSSSSESNAGVSILGLVSVNSGALTLTGTAGSVNATNSTATDGEDTSGLTSVGVAVESEDDADSSGGLSSGGGSTVHITGTGGAIITTSNFTGESVGVTFGPNTVSDFGTPPEEQGDAESANALPATASTGGSTVTINGTGGSVNAGTGEYSGDANSIGVHFNGIVSVEDGGSLTAVGTGGALNASQASAASGDSIPTTEGISFNNDANVAAFGSSSLTFTGTGGTVTAGSNKSVGSIGVNVGDDSLGGGTSISVEDGKLTITGTAGSSPSLGAGVVLHGFNGGQVNIDASPDENSAETNGSIANQIQITGTGGSGYTGGGTITGNYVPDSGVIIADNVSISSSEGITISGKGGANSNGVTINTLTSDSTLDEQPVSPQISGPVITITSTGGSMLINGGISAYDQLTITSPGTIDLEDTGDSGGISTDDLSITAAGAILINNTISGDGTDSIVSTGGDITLGDSASLSDTGEGHVLTLAAGTAPPHGHFINNNSEAGADVITVSNGATFDLYESQSSNNTLGGITVPSGNVVTGATYPNNTVPSGNGELFFGSGGSTTTTTTTTPSDGGGSNVVPPAIVPQNNDVVTSDLASIWGGSVIPPFSFSGGSSNQSGGGSGGLANSSGNGGQVGAGDAAQLGGGGIYNVQNPAASGALNVALGIAVHSALSAALASFGDWTDADYSPSDDNQDNAGGGNGETLLNSGDVVVIGNNGVKSIPPNQAPAPLQKALGNSVRNGLSTP